MLAATCLFTVLTVCPAASTDADWGRECLGEDSHQPFFPDAYVNYWIYAFDRTGENRNIGIRLTGEFPSARYMSLNLYDKSTFSAIDSRADYQIKADRGSTNPFVAQKKLRKKPRSEQSYTLLVVPEQPETKATENTLTFDGDVSCLSIILRYYLPEIDNRGGVPLPSLEAFDTQTGETVPLPPSAHRALPPAGTLRRTLRTSVRDNLIQRALAKSHFSVIQGSRLRSYRFSESNLYANRDNRYLVMPIERQSSEVALVKFKPPAGRKDVCGRSVRYWSISQCDDRSYAHTTLADHEVNISDDGYVRLVIGDPTSRVVARAEPHNLMPWKAGSRIVLIYRNLLSHSSYQHSIGQVPEFNSERPLARQSGDRFIGEYAPSGVLVPEATFVKEGFPDE